MCVRWHARARAGARVRECAARYPSSVRSLDCGKIISLSSRVSSIRNHLLLSLSRNRVPETNCGSEIFVYEKRDFNVFSGVIVADITE